MHLQKDCTRCKDDKKIPTPNGVKGTQNTKKREKANVVMDIPRINTWKHNLFWLKILEQSYRILNVESSELEKETNQLI